MAVAEQDDDVMGIILTGARRGFCAGVDMNALRDIQAAGTDAAMREEIEIEPLELGDKSMGPDFAFGYTQFLTVRKPILAAINGPCAGAGLAMKMFCDLRFVSENAIFTTAFAQRGLVAEAGTSWILPGSSGRRGRSTSSGTVAGYAAKRQ